MNDDARYEQLFADALADLAPTRASDRLKTDIKQATGRSRPRPRWLAATKEPPMRLSSALAVGSPTARIAAILAATVLIAAAVVGAGIAGSRLLAADGTVVVDQSGGGDFSAISAAVAAAQDGDTVLVRPGTYVEAVVVDTDIELRGDGPVEEIVIMAPDDGPTAPIILTEPFSEEDPYAILLRDTNATLSGLTFEGEPSEVFASGGSPTLEHLRFIGTGFPFDGSTTSARGSSIVVNDGSTATIRDSTISSGGPIGVFDGASPLIEGNSLTGGPHIWGDFGDGTVIRGNTIDGTVVRAIGIFEPSGEMVIEGNTIVDPGETGVHVGFGDPAINENHVSGATRYGVYAERDASPSITGNQLEDNQYGVYVATSGAPVVSGNQLVGNSTGIAWRALGEGAIEVNSVRDGGVGIVVSQGDPRVAGNLVEGNDTRGVVVSVGASPVMSDNTICDNVENLVVTEGATPTIDDTNEICEDAPIE